MNKVLQKRLKNGNLKEKKSKNRNINKLTKLINKSKHLILSFSSASTESHLVEFNI